jgi:putative ABC transport system ATP-binding protein
LEPNLFRFIWNNSKRQQLIVLAVIVLSLPFYFASFDIPKQIINDALQGKAFAPGATEARFFAFMLPLPAALGGPVVISDGFMLSQLDLLWALSGIFLALVIINGGFKYYINLMKGVMGERLLRRLRFVLLDQYLRLRPEDIRGVKPAEAASIVKDEVDPVGGFAGDAFILPAFLGMQALTAVTFILVQSVMLGLVALSVVLIQAAVIPRLRRQQLVLTQMRQVESRKLAGRIGEVVETAPVIHNHETGAFVRAETGTRLGVLFDIRVALFKRKFAVKYLNNLLAQVTPFFFYAIGGYLALNGSLNIGQLFAAIAAYKDLPPPIKELIDWDQARADVIVKYQQIVEQFPENLLPPDDASEPMVQLPETGDPLSVKSLKVVDNRGVMLLEPMTVTLPRPAHVALVGAAGGGRDTFARILGRQIVTYQGSLAIGRWQWSAMGDRKASRLMAYVGPEPLLSSGTLRDNIIVALRRAPHSGSPILKPDMDKSEIRKRYEAEMSGNIVLSPGEDWLDLNAAGVSSLDDLDEEVLRVLQVTGLAEDVYRLALLGRIDPTREEAFVARIPEARDLIVSRLKSLGLTKSVEPLDADRFNRYATLGENLLFGKRISGKIAQNTLTSDPYVRSILEAEALLHPLAAIGMAMAETAIDVFADLPPNDPLFERFSSISAEDMPDFVKLLETARARGGFSKLSTGAKLRLAELATSYLETRHRLGLVTPQLERRILRARASLRLHLPQSYAGDIEFYSRERYMASASIQDNLLFGRIAFGAADAAVQVQAVMRQSLVELGLDRELRRIGLDFEAGPSGRFLHAEQRASVALARSLLARPSILIIDGALASFSQSEARLTLARIRQEMVGRTVIATLSQPDQCADFDAILTFENTRMVDVHFAAAGPSALTAQTDPGPIEAVAQPGA